jgi:hypothetical protein
MKHIHLIRTGETPEALRELFDAVAACGLRFGWLDLGDRALPDEPLTRAVRAGALRAVEVGCDGSTTRKTRRGPVVLGDLLRENFGGCAVVFARAAAPVDWTDSRWIAAPSLSRVDADRFRLDGERGAQEWSARALAERLRSPLAV